MFYFSPDENLGMLLDLKVFRIKLYIMVNAQEWLDREYPKKWIDCIHINQQLEGVLDCSDYYNLFKIFISTQVDSSKFEIKNASNPEEESEVVHCIPAQEWLDKHYPKDETCLRKDDYDRNKKHEDYNKTRTQITELDIEHKGLEGSLDLSDFTNLRELKCRENDLTNLNVSNCNKLNKINCYINQLTTLDLSNLEQLKEFCCYNNYLTQIIYPTNLEEITELNIYDNNLSPQDLSIFKKFGNLKRLDISNSDKNKILQGIYNRIEGSLKPLKDLKLTHLNISNTDLNTGIEYLPESLEKIEYDTDLRPNCKLAQVAEQWDQELWKDIHQKFAPEWKKEWLEAGFSKEQTKKLFQELNKNIELIRPWDGNFLNWFLNFKKLGLSWALENEEEFKDLRDKYRHFGTCEECQQPNTSGSYKWSWCQSCSAKHFQDNFSNWTSGNPNIDNFIQKCQLEATSDWNVLEWIPYEQFKNIEHIANGGFGKVEKADWEGGKIESWNNWKKKWERSQYDKTVALKTLTNSQNLNQDFLQELTLYKTFESEVNNVVPCYGVSKDKDDNYIMVMKYMKEGDLREYLKKNYKKLKFYDDAIYFAGGPSGDDRLNFFSRVVQGLKDIHRKNLVHRDFHSGNIIVDKEYSRFECRIADLGLSKPVGEVDNNQVYGVIPYMAPEVLQGQPYTPASDVYSFGIVAYEILTGLSPFAEQNHDVNLALQICQGARPKFPEQVKYPQLLINLIQRCWDNDPNNRPTAREISGIVAEWFGETKNGILRLVIDTEFCRQYEEAQAHNKTLPDEIRYPTYQDNHIWHSKPIDTKTITQKLQQKTEEEYWGSKEFTLDGFNIPEDTQEDPQEQSSHQAQIEVPPKNS